MKDALIKLECWQGSPFGAGWFDWAEYSSLLAAEEELLRLIGSGRKVRWTNLGSGIEKVYSPDEKYTWTKKQQRIVDSARR